MDVSLHFFQFSSNAHCTSQSQMKYSYPKISFSNKHKESFGRENLNCKMTELEGRDIDYWDFVVYNVLSRNLT